MDNMCIECGRALLSIGTFETPRGDVCSQHCAIKLLLKFIQPKPPQAEPGPIKLVSQHKVMRVLQDFGQSTFQDICEHSYQSQIVVQIALESLIVKRSVCIFSNENNHTLTFGLTL